MFSANLLQPQKFLTLILVVFGIATTSAYAADARGRKFISQGMSEGAVLMKIGRPDSESIYNGHYATDKHWIYFPDSGDSQTLTTITLRDGKVIKVNREISR